MGKPEANWPQYGLDRDSPTGDRARDTHTHGLDLLVFITVSHQETPGSLGDIFEQARDTAFSQGHPNSRGTRKTGF